MEQLAINFGQEKALVCEHRRWVESLGRVWCARHDVWTLCHVPFCGELLGCAYDEPDNSPEACARRVRWLQDHKTQGGNVDA